MPLTFEANRGQAEPRTQFLGRSQRLSLLLTNTGIEIHPARSPQPHSRPEFLKLAFAVERHNSHGLSTEFCQGVIWKGIEKLQAESNYLIGSDPKQWHQHIPHFARAEADAIIPGVDAVVYSSAEELEYDLRVAPDVNADDLRLTISGSRRVRLNSDGDLLLQVGDSQLRMRKPAVYEEVRGRVLSQREINSRPPPRQLPIDGAFVIESDGSVGFHIGERIPNTTLVIDPSLSVVYTTFLGGTGEDSANSIALDSTGKVFIGGTTTSAQSFSEPSTKPTGPGGGTDFFIAKIDPSLAGTASLVYLTFLGGTGNESGGLIAVDKSGNLAITGTTTSPDYPVTDGSVRTSGLNDVAVTELGPTGATLVYSTLFGGSGAESTQNPGGIALDSSGDIFVASDTTSADLPFTTGAFQIANGGGTSDGFLAVFRPAATPHVKYCTYLGIDAQVGIGGVAVDATGNAYIAGFTSDPGTTFPALNGFLATYAGDPSDGFVIKIRPSGTGASDLAYGTFLGGAALDQALAITVGTSLPATVYVTGTTQSTNFPTNGSSGAAQSSLKGTANAFVAAIAQNAGTGMTSLLYSTYLGGTQSDTGLSISFVAPNALYIAGKTTSWDFPWLNNFQPFNGNEDAFVAKLDPTSSGPASLIYATPLAGTAPPGGTAVTDGNAIAAGVSGNVYVAGRSTSSDFPRAGNPGNGMQLTCASCQELPPAADAFVLAFQESATAAPSVSFTAPRLNFGAQAVGAQNIPPLFAAVVNTGTAPITIAVFAVGGPNRADFSLVGSDACLNIQLQPRATCEFEVAFSPSIVGPEQGFLSVQDNAPGSPQVLALAGTGNGPFAAISTPSLSFGAQPQGSASDAQIVTITNEGNQDLHLSDAGIGGPDASQFFHQSLGPCFGPPVPPGGNCIVGIVFAPSGTGPYQAELDILDDSGGVVGAQQIVALSGTGIAPAPIAAVLPAAVVFGVQSVTTTSSPQSVKLINRGSAALAISHISIIGPDAASFGIAPTGDGSCPIGSGSLAISASCTVSIDFAPQSGGAKNATVSFADNASGSPQLVTLAGTAIAPTIQISPISVNFAPQSVGTASASQTITLSNAGSSTVAINNPVSVTGANAGDFTESSNCSSVLGMGSSCVVNVTFAPTAAGNRSAAILVSDDAAGGPHTIPLAGMATQSAVSLSPTSLNFSSQLVGAPSQPTPITVMNSGSGSLQIAGISFGGTNPADFSETDTCKGTIAPSGSCTVSVIFTPAAVGPRSGALLLADNALNSPQSVSLTAAAMDFSINPQSLGATSATITAGQTATYQLAIQSIDGFTGPVSFTCTGAPVGATCTVNPSPLTVAANVSAPFQVSVSTTAQPQTGKTQLSSSNLHLTSGAIYPATSFRQGIARSMLATILLMLLVLPFHFVTILRRDRLELVVRRLGAFPLDTLPLAATFRRYQTQFVLQLLTVTQRRSHSRSRLRNNSPSSMPEDFPCIAKISMTEAISAIATVLTAIAIVIALSITQIACGSGASSGSSTGTPTTPAGAYTLVVTASTPNLASATESVSRSSFAISTKFPTTPSSAASVATRATLISSFSPIASTTLLSTSPDSSATVTSAQKRISPSRSSASSTLRSASCDTPSNSTPASTSTQTPSPSTSHTISLTITVQQ